MRRELTAAALLLAAQTSLAGVLAAQHGDLPWAYEPPGRPDLPAAAPGTHPIDALLEARMRSHGLEPAPEADRHTLIRRLSLDLIGLPPSPDEVAAFVADEAEGAYERLVDRLLASPHYGERWARPWLDLSRYADTNGYNFDGPRSMWRWRDWVIDALNRDLPFDEFTVQQLAGDLLPDADEASRIATGFHRNTMLNNEGGVDPAEARWERLLDRASTTATVWLGSTFHCARCHDHKFDPITQRDFYALVAFFETQDEVELGPSEQERKAEIARCRARIDRLRAEGAGADEILAAERDLRRARLQSTLVLQERSDATAETPLHPRGGFDDVGEAVPAGTPAALHPWPEGAPYNRLGLARWLCSPDNPLVARAHCNRVWDVLFGKPLCPTPEDLGTQAPEPLHRDVLDWLAVEFVASGWSQKQLIRTIVTTRAYRRSARVVPDQRERDPGNDYYARGQRFRLEAEQVRDLMLSVSGLLCLDMGGPSVFPLQADTSGAVALNKVNMSWQPSPGPDRYRRGVYTYWRRTAPFVQFALFDAPSREECVVRRERTNTPLQALSGLNDPAAWEAAEALGERMQRHDGDDRDRLAFGFLLCTSRRPTGVELDRLLQALQVERADAPEQAWARIANALLNLDETLTRG